MNRNGIFSERLTSTLRPYKGTLSSQSSSEQTLRGSSPKTHLLCFFSCRTPLLSHTAWHLSATQGTRRGRHTQTHRCSCGPAYRHLQMFCQHVVVIAVAQCRLSSPLQRDWAHQLSSITFKIIIELNVLLHLPVFKCRNKKETPQTLLNTLQTS